MGSRRGGSGGSDFVEVDYGRALIQLPRSLVRRITIIRVDELHEGSRVRDLRTSLICARRYGAPECPSTP